MRGKSLEHFSFMIIKKGTVGKCTVNIHCDNLYDRESLIKLRFSHGRSFG
jgi:hypothetical protein